MRNKKRYIYIGGTIFLLVIFLLGSYFAFRREHPSKYEVQFAYAVTSIDPSIYDDWESVFIGNHIYYRLLPDENKPSIPYLTKTLSITCEKPISLSSNDNCKPKGKR